jgi:predicted alpha/beta-fold hydrolase
MSAEAGVWQFFVKWGLNPFQPLFRNPHVLTILANFATRRLDTERFPVRERLYQTDPDAQVLVHEQRPVEPAKGEIVLVHGLEGSSDAGLHPQHVPAFVGTWLRSSP